MILLMIARVAGAEPPPLPLGYWSSITKIDVEISVGVGGALHVAFQSPTGPQSCDEPTAAGDTITCSTPGGGGRFIHTFRMVDGDVLLDRLSGSIPDDAVPVVAFFSPGRRRGGIR